MDDIQRHKNSHPIKNHSGEASRRTACRQHPTLKRGIVHQWLSHAFLDLSVFGELLFLRLFLWFHIPVSQGLGMLSDLPNQSTEKLIAIARSYGKLNKQHLTYLFGEYKRIEPMSASACNRKQAVPNTISH